MTPKLPGLLVRYIQQKRCVVFVGAGLSAGAGLPTWKALLLKGIEELVGSLPEGESHQDELRKLVEYGKLLEVAEFCKDKLGAAYHQFLTDQVRGDQAQVPATHDVLMHLPFSAWVTTNYDKLLERAYSQAKGGFPKTLTHMDTEALGRLLFEGGEFILKAHGDIDRPDTVVLTSRDYAEIIHGNPAFNEAFTGLLLTKAVLFLGYSLSDPDFRLLMDRQLTHFKGFVPERYALMTGVGPVEQDVLWRTARIRVISYENQSGKHAEVGEFLQALKAAVSPAPAPQAVSVKTSVPAAIPAPAGQPGTIRTHNVSGTPSPRAPSSGFMRGLLEGVARAMEAEDVPAPEATKMALELGSIPPAQASPASAAPVPPPSRQPAGAPAAQPASREPLVLFVEQTPKWRIRFRLVLPGGVGTAELGDLRLHVRVWELLHEVFMKKKGTELPASIYSDLTRIFVSNVPQEVFAALGKRGSLAQVPLVLNASDSTSRFPWELLPIQGQPICLQCQLARAPVGVSDQARGTPQVRPVPRVLLIEGPDSARRGEAREIERLARQYQTAQGFSCTVLQGTDATFARIMAELDAGLPDLVHYTGNISLLDGEPVLKLPGDTDLSVEALRSALSKGRLPFLVMNAPSSAFIPPVFGVYPTPDSYRRRPPSPATNAAFEGREGFMDLAAQAGVGAFIGTFDMPSAQAGTAFMVSLHRNLITGLPVAEAVLQARRETRKQFPDDPTALQYVLSGDGNLQLWDSQRENTEG